MSESQAVPPRLAEIIDEFKWAEGQEKLELLLEYARNMPALPERFKAQRDQMEQVHECMTPVFIQAETTDRKMTFFFDVPEESPTVRGYAALLAEGVNGSTPEEILAIPSEFYTEMGLQDVLSPRRLNGVHTILAYLKRLATRELTHEAAAS